MTFEKRDQCPTSLQLDSVHTSSDGYLHVLLHQYSVRIPVFGARWSGCTVTALDLKHGTLFRTPMTWLLSHAATLRNCGVLHLDVESKHLILDAALF